MRQAKPAFLQTLVMASVFCSASVASHAARIVIDVGHNLANPGTTSAYGETEFSYNQALADVVVKQLQAAGHVVKVVGADGLMNELKPRAEAASGSDLFISLHHDSMKQEYLEEWLVNGQSQWMSERFRGYSLYVFSDGPAYAQSLHCAGMISQAMQSRGFQPTLHHSDGIAGENRPLLDRQLGIYQANFAVLKHNSIPALLLEAGVIRHPEEAKQLKQHAVQQNIAKAITAGLDCLLR